MNNESDLPPDLIEYDPHDQQVIAIYIYSIYIIYNQESLIHFVFNLCIQCDAVVWN